MVHVYNCHPFSSQRIVPTEQEPGLVCCGGGALFVLSAGGCKIDVFDAQREQCPLICRFSTMGLVHSIVYSQIGDYLVTIEEKNGATYLRAYTNWRYQGAEKKRVGVRLLGHLMRGQALQGTPKEQMEIVEIPLSEAPRCASCCPITGSLLVACTKSLVLFGLKHQLLSELHDALDFERLLIVNVPGWCPQKVALCGGYVALQTELEVLVLKLENLEKEKMTRHKHPYSSTMPSSDQTYSDIKKEPQSPVEPDDFFVFPKHLEMLGDDAKDCGVSVSLERTGMETEADNSMEVTYILYRRFAPDFFQGCSVEETRLHSLQLHPMYTGHQNTSGGTERGEPSYIFCFFSLPNAGYVYSLKNTVELISTYQYPEKALQSVLCNKFLYVITRNALQCFSVRCSAVAARAEDPYIDTTMKACPPVTMEVCAMRIQLFIGLKALCCYGKQIILLTAADVDSKAETERGARRTISRKTSVSKVKEPSDGGHGWNLYILSTVTTLQLYREMVEYSKRYEQTNPLSQNCLHLLNEAHLLLLADHLCPDQCDSTDRSELQQAFQESCAQLGDCFSRLDKRDSHLALPYYKMSGLSVTEVIERNVAMCRAAVVDYGKGFLFFLKHSLYEETMEVLSEETANMVLEIFSKSEPSQLPYVVSSSFMKNVSPARALEHLEKLELNGAPSVTLTLCKAAQALRLGDLHYYQQQMDRHAEMLQVYGFIEDPKLLVHGRGKAVVPTQLAQHLHDTQDGLLVAAMVALHENSKVKLDEAERFFRELCSAEPQSVPQLLVDFWEALLVASSQEAIIQELLFHLTSVYTHRIIRRERSGIKALKTAEDLINSSSHYGVLYPWVSILTPLQFNITHDHQEDLQKLQSLLCGPTLDVSSIVPLLEQLSDADSAGLSIHVLCATKLGQHSSAIEKLLDCCPQAIIPYSNHELQNDKLVLWWQKLFPELCKRARASSGHGDIIDALKETLVVVAMLLNPVELLDLLPDDGTADFFLPHLLECSLRHLRT